MIIYSISKRIKNFFRVTIQDKKKSEKIFMIRDDRYLTDIKNKEGYYRFFYPNGNVRAECHYIDDKLEGISNFYYLSGKIKSKENYREGELNGISQFFYESGQIKCEVYYNNGISVWRKEYDEKGYQIR